MTVLALLFLLSCVCATDVHHHDKSSSSSKTRSSSKSSSSHCEDCQETKSRDDGDNHHVDYGACCFGDRSLGEDFTYARCAYVWAGPDTNANDCANLKPCCRPDEGICTHEHCFDCVTGGGNFTRFCDDCKQHKTTKHKTTTTETTKAPKTHAPTPKPHHNSPGCCCTVNHPPRKTTAEECHKISGFYRGDGSSCNDEDVCQARCCDPVTRICAQCETFNDWSSSKFIGFGSESCCKDTCGVTCCINAKAVNAESADSCTRQGGLVMPNVAVEDAVCPSGCCIQLNFTLQTNQVICQYSGGRWLGQGVGFSPGICGGCGCYSDQLEPHIISEQDCAADPLCVYQGNDTACPAPPPSDRRRKRSPDESDSDSSSSTDSWFSDSEKSIVDNSEFTDVCSNDGCCCYKDANGTAVKRVVSDSLACYELHGVFQGEGVLCSMCECEKGVCCDGRGSFPVNSKAECDLKGGRYAGDGTNIYMPGVCDHTGGACLCDPHKRTEHGDHSDEHSSSKSHGRKRGAPWNNNGNDDVQCLEVPNATVCEAFGCGNTAFQGVGTRCNEWAPPTPPPAVTHGACCLPRAFDMDTHICEIANNHSSCSFFGGLWNGAGSKCGDDTCAAIKGRCCLRGAQRNETRCVDGWTSASCKEKDGHWGGPDSLCSDEFACDPKHSGACCRKGCSCSVLTPKVCHHVGGSFKGFESSCQDDNNAVCKICTPCEVEAPSCSEAKPCENRDATCVREYGKCMILATPIRSSYNYTIGDDGHGSADNFGPLSCGSKHTIGAPCLAKPLLGKCRIGVCSEPPKGSTLSESCESVCWHIKDYDCGCKCDGAWLRTCASISGRVIDDKDKNYKYNHTVDGLVTGAAVRAYRWHDDRWHFVAQQTTSSKGHYAFINLEPGRYEVLVKLPGCFTSETTKRRVEVECLEQSSDGFRAAKHSRSIEHVSAYSANLEVRERATHLADHVDFYAREDCDTATVHKKHEDDSSSSSSSSNHQHEPIHHSRRKLEEGDNHHEASEKTDKSGKEGHSPSHDDGERGNHHDRHDNPEVSTLGIIIIVAVAVVCCLGLLGLFWYARQGVGRRRSS